MRRHASVIIALRLSMRANLPVDVLAAAETSPVLSANLRRSATPVLVAAVHHNLHPFKQVDAFLLAARS